MTRREWSLAKIAAAQLGLPGLPDQHAARRVLALDQLDKWTPALHPRWPAHSTEAHGGTFRPRDGGDGLAVPAQFRPMLPPVAPRPIPVPAPPARPVPAPPTEPIPGLGHNAPPEPIEPEPPLIVTPHVPNAPGPGPVPPPLSPIVLPPVGAEQETPGSLAAASDAGAAVAGLTSVLSQVPKRSWDIYNAGRRVADALADAYDKGEAETVDAIASAVDDAGVWLKREYPNIVSYLDPPKTYEEMRDAARNPPQNGYEDHHIVEKGPQNDDLPQAQLEEPDNILRIPEYKHREITRYYQTEDPDLDGLTPRQYLRGKPFGERFQFGLGVIRRFGVLK